MNMDVHAEEVTRKIRKIFQSGKARLPILPDAVIKVRNIIQDERKGANDIADVIGHDATFSTTVLKLANSARFNVSGREIRSLPIAIQRLGGKRTLQLLIAISSKMYVSVSKPELQSIVRKTSEHSIMVAAAAQHLARLLRGPDPEEAFLAGLLCEVGVAAVISAAPNELMSCPEEMRLNVIRRLRREMGSRLLTYWGMPDIFVAIASHHGIESDDRPRDKLIDLVDTANFLVQQAGHPHPLDPLSETLEVSHFPPFLRLGATETHLAAVEIELEDGFTELQQIFG